MSELINVLVNQIFFFCELNYFFMYIYFKILMVL